MPFLFLPLGIFSTPVMATLSLPNITFGIQVWYINPPTNTPPKQLKPYTYLNLVQPIILAPFFASVLQKPQKESNLVAKSSSDGGKAQRKGPKDKSPQVTSPPKLPKHAPPCALCDIFRYANNNCHELCLLRMCSMIIFQNLTFLRSMSPYLSPPKIINPCT